MFLRQRPHTPSAVRASPRRHPSCLIRAGNLRLNKAHRQANTHQGDEQTQTAWAQGGIDAPEQGAGMCVNFVGDEGKARLRAAYPAATVERLTVIKARYDPTNLFRRHHNIRLKT